MVYYNLSNSSDMLSYHHFFKYVNNTSGGLMFPVLLFVLWIIIFLASLNSGNRIGAGKSFLFASFICTILGAMLSVLGLVAMKWVYLCILFLGIGAVIEILKNARDT